MTLVPPLPRPWPLDDVIFKGRTALKKQASACNDCIEELEKEIQTHAQTTDAILGIDVESEELLNAIAVSTPAEERARILQEILKFRRDQWQPFLEEMASALADERGKAHTAWEEARQRVTQQLVEFGYHDASGEIDPCKILPVFIMSHPRVFGAMQYKQDMAARACNNAFAIENQAGIEGLLNELNEVRRRHVHAAKIGQLRTGGIGRPEPRDRA